MSVKCFLLIKGNVEDDVLCGITHALRWTPEASPNEVLNSMERHFFTTLEAAQRHLGSLNVNDWKIVEINVAISDVT